MNLELLRIYTLSVDGTTYSVFNGADHPIDLTEYSYSAERMGSTTLTATLRYIDCLDDSWTGREFVVLDESSIKGNGSILSLEKFFLTHTPSSKKSYDDERYVHTLEFHSERDALLSSVYFYDAVSSEASTKDRYQSNSFNVTFFGTLQEFVARFNDVLAYRNISDRFAVEIENGVGTTDAKEVSFSESTLFDALSTAYETWSIPFYFLGNKAVFGNNDEDIPSATFEYGAQNELLTISKNNKNSKIVTRCTGYGSEDNIPYYYPNPTAKGTLKALYNGTDGRVTINSQYKFGENFPVSDTLTYYGGSAECTIEKVTIGDQSYYNVPMAQLAGYSFAGCKNTVTVVLRVKVVNDQYKGGINFKLDLGANSLVQVAPKVKKADEETTYFEITKVHGLTLDNIPFSVVEYREAYRGTEGDKLFNAEFENRNPKYDIYERLPEVYHFDLGTLDINEYLIYINGYVTTIGYKFNNPNDAMTEGVKRDVVLAATPSVTSVGGGWRWSDDIGLDNLSKVGISISGSPVVGDKITQSVVQYIRPSNRLLPYTYRQTLGENLFYNAENNKYPIPGGTGYYHFTHEYNPKSPNEHIEEFEDIKPSIKNLTIDGTKRNVLAGVDFDSGYNIHDTVTDSDGNKKNKYSRFYIKLKPLGFNIFTSAIESGEMTISMISGPCAGCNFKVLVSESGKNPVQVDSSGNLVKDSSGKVDLNASNPIEAQNDTTNNSVWIAVYLDSETYGGEDTEYGIMPSYDDNTKRGQKPEINDEFTIINILLPDVMIENAEKELEKQILEFMVNNNDDKYSFTIDFSRIYLAQNPDVRSSLSEHCSLNIKYDGKQLAAPLYVSTYTYKVSNGSPLPEIGVELSGEIEVRRSAISEKISASVQSVVNVVGGYGDTEVKDDEKYVRNDVDNTISGKLTLKKGAEFGDFTYGHAGSGAAINIGEDGSSYAEVDFLKVRKKATFTQLDIENIKSVGGQLVVSLAQIKVVNVSVEDNAYKCYLSDTSEDGVTLENKFVVGDLAVCKNFSNNDLRYYWRKVVAVGVNYISLSNASGEYDADSDVPAKGDTIVQLGNVSDTSRQAAQILSCYGDNTPSMVMYAGINSFDLTGKDIFGVIYKHVSGTTYEPFLFNYGSMLLGKRDKTKDYFEYVNSTGALNIKANVTLNAGSDVSNVQTIKDLQGGVSGLGYLKTALANGTEVYGGLILSSLIALRDASNNVKSGLNGVYDATKTGGGIAGWYGGPMVDHEADASAADYAASLFRFDGTGYLAKGNITWDSNGYGQVGGSGSNYAVKWDADGVHLASGITIGSSSDTLGQLLSAINSLNAMFTLETYTENGETKHRIKANYDGLYSDGFVSAGGVSTTQGGGSGGGVEEYDTTNTKYASLSALGSSAYLTKYDYTAQLERDLDALEARVVELEDGGGDKNFVYTQGSPSADWEIQHNLGKMPSVSLVVNGHQCFGDVEFVDTNKVIVHLGMAVSGNAYLN